MVCWRKTEGEENDEVEEQMGVLALPTEKPNQRKITPPTSLSAESSHFKLWIEKESTKAGISPPSRSKCPCRAAHFVRFDFFFASYEMTVQSCDPFIPRSALSMTSFPSQINHRRLIRQYCLKPPLRHIKLIFWPNCHFDDMFKAKNFSVWHFISCVIGAAD